MINLKTVREVAEELNISRQAVYSKLTVKFKEKFTTIKKINNRDTLVINKAGVEWIKNDIVKLDSQVDCQLDNLLDNQIDSQLVELLKKNIEILQKQLEIKDQQIMELNQRLKEAQDLNRNNQILLHREQEQPKMIESKSKFSLKKWLGIDKEQQE